MKTQLFKARDMKTAMNLVNDEYGDKAIILSTKKNNGVIEVEASDNEDIIETHKKKVSVALFIGWHWLIVYREWCHTRILAI